MFMRNQRNETTHYLAERSSDTNQSVEKLMLDHGIPKFSCCHLPKLARESFD